MKKRPVFGPKRIDALKRELSTVPEPAYRGFLSDAIIINQQQLVDSTLRLMGSFQYTKDAFD